MKRGLLQGAELTPLLSFLSFVRGRGVEDMRSAFRGIDIPRGKGEIALTDLTRGMEVKKPTKENHSAGAVGGEARLIEGREKEGRD